MTTVTGFTSERMLEIENTTIVDGDVVGDNLILKQRDDTEINAGNVRGPMGPSGSGHHICTSLTRPSYVSGDEGKTIYETDTNIVRIWTGTRFEIKGPIICTSGTRPAIEYFVTADDGVEIYETDTNLKRILDADNMVWKCQPYVIVASAANRPSDLGAHDEGVLVYERDTNFTWRWNGTAWRIATNSICTSSTRPSGLGTGDEGAKIYETDTNDNYYWNGTTWRRAHGDMGRLDSSSSGGDVDCLDPASTVTSVTIVTTEQRIVSVGATARGHQVTADASSVSAYVDSTGTHIMSVIKNLFFSNNLDVGDTIVGSVYFTLTLPAGTTTFRLRARSNAGAVRMEEGCQIFVNDVAAG